MNSSTPPADGDAAARLSAWLDGQLDAGEAAAVSAQVDSDPDLRAQAEDFQRLDAVLKDWYAGLPVEDAAAAATPAPVATASSSRRRYRLLPLAGVLAAAVAIVLLAIPLLQGRSALSLAQEVMDNTGRALLASKGLVATFRVSSVKYGADPQAAEKRSGEGVINFGDLNVPFLVFQSKETWAATAEEEAVTRERLQTRRHQVVSEEYETSSSGHTLTGPFDLESQLQGFQQEYKGGSPVDVRSRRAVEGLAMLVRGFRSDRFLQWMGYKWTYQKGTGTRADPWVYVTTPGTLDPKTKPAAEPIAWTLLLCSGDGGIIKTVTLKEAVTDLKTSRLVEELQTEYDLALRNEPWPKAMFADEDEDAENDN